MKAYLFWVIIIYFPIAFLMGWILRNNGLPTRNILTIIIMSLLVIVMFPISMARLGTALSLGLYAAILFIIGHYLVQNQQLKVEQTTDAITANPEIASGLDYAGELNLPLNSLTNEPRSNQAAPNVIKDETSNIFMLSNVLTEQNIPETNKSVGLDIEEIPLKTEEKTTEQDIIPQSGKQELGCELPVKEDDSVLMEINQHHNEQKIDNVTQQVITENAQSGIISNVEKSELIKPESMETKLQEPQSLSDDNDVIQVNLREEESAPETVDEFGEKSNIEMNKEREVLPEQTATWLEHGFEFKEKGDLKAALYEFNKAWHETDDNDLSFLLAMEIFELYRIIGDYTEAEQALTWYAGKMQNIPAIMKEITPRIEWIKLLRTELIRLGIAELPYAQLPRWVKLKVAEASGIEQY